MIQKSSKFIKHSKDDVTIINVHEKLTWISTPNTYDLLLLIDAVCGRLVQHVDVLPTFSIKAVPNLDDSD